MRFVSKVDKLPKIVDGLRPVCLTKLYPFSQIFGAYSLAYIGLLVAATDISSVRKVCLKSSLLEWDFVVAKLGFVGLVPYRIFG